MRKTILQKLIEIRNRAPDLYEALAKDDISLIGKEDKEKEQTMPKVLGYRTKKKKKKKKRSY